MQNGNPCVMFLTRGKVCNFCHDRMVATVKTSLRSKDFQMPIQTITNGSFSGVLNSRSFVPKSGANVTRP